MKFLKQIQIDNKKDYSDLQRMTADELIKFIGGTGCCWDTMAKMYNTIYRPEQEISASYFKGKWEDWLEIAKEQDCSNSDLDESGDPTIHQTGYLLGFLKQYFTTEASWNEERVNGSYNFTIIKDPGYSDEHAVIITGSLEHDWSTGKDYYTCYDTSIKDTRRIEASWMIANTNISAY